MTRNPLYSLEPEAYFLPVAATPAEPENPYEALAKRKLSLAETAEMRQNLVGVFAELIATDRQLKKKQKREARSK